MAVGVSVRVLHMGSPFKLALESLDWLMVHVVVPHNAVDFSRPVCGVRGLHVGYPFFPVREEDESLCTFGEQTHVRLKVLIQVRPATLSSEHEAAEMRIHILTASSCLFSCLSAAPLAMPSSSTGTEHAFRCLLLLGIRDTR